MKILHIISQPPDFTGSGKFISQIIQQSNRLGHQNFLLAGVQSDFNVPPELLPENQCLFVRFETPDILFPIPGMSDIMPYKSRVFSSLTTEEISAYKAAFKIKIIAAIKRFSPDIIHSHHLWVVSALVRSATKDIPMVTTCHGTCLRQHYLCPTLGKTLVKDLQQIDQVIALSRDQKQNIIDTLGIKSEKIHVISGGYNQACFFYKPKEFEGTVHLLYAGKLSYSKGVPWLLNSLAQIKDLPFQLHIAGSSTGKEKQDCLELVNALGSKARYHGSVSHERLGELMQKAHIFVLPSFYEGLPLVLMEAAACGCKIITTDLAGVKEIFGEEKNPMVDLVELPKLETIDRPFQKDMDELQTTLSGILKQNIESMMYDALPDMESVCSVSSKFTWDTIFSRIQSVYSGLFKTVKSG